MAARKSAIDTKFIRELAELLNETDLQEVEVEEGEMRIRLSRSGGMVAPQMMMAPQQAAPAAAPAPAPQQQAAPAPAASDAASAKTGDAVPSPMVGTAYHCPAPDADAFVKVGQSVKKGDTVMIIEAMKTMNQIPATRDGKVVSIDVEDGQPVEFGQSLITIA